VKPFQAFKGVVAFLDRANVDTDQIIAKQFLKSIKRTGFGEQLFYDWRYDERGNPNPDFSLNKPEAAGAEILVTRGNFGCGSSREHAVWAVHQYGFKAIVAPRTGEGSGVIPGFADIFKNNCAKNGLLTVELPASDVDEIFKLSTSGQKIQATVDLENNTIFFEAGAKKNFSFEIDGAVKERLLKGLDDIGITLQQESAIEAFEKKCTAPLPEKVSQ